MTLALVLAATGLKAQDCDAIMLPYFKGDANRMQAYKENAPEKFQYRCNYATAAFIESDTIPAGLDVFNISEVKEIATGKNLSERFVVDLNTLSYYAYDFSRFQAMRHPDEVRVCFRTPGSSHPYLVLRSMMEMGNIANELFDRR